MQHRDSALKLGRSGLRMFSVFERMSSLPHPGLSLSGPREATRVLETEVLI